MQTFSLISDDCRCETWWCCYIALVKTSWVVPLHRFAGLCQRLKSVRHTSYNFSHPLPMAGLLQLLRERRKKEKHLLTVDCTHRSFPVDKRKIQYINFTPTRRINHSFVYIALRLRPVKESLRVASSISMARPQP